MNTVMFIFIVGEINYEFIQHLPFGGQKCIDGCGFSIYNGPIWVRVMGVLRHYQQYSSYIVAVSLIGNHRPAESL